MLLSVISIEEETENEIEVEVCCPSCCRDLYGWNKEQFEKVYAVGISQINNEAVKTYLQVPENVIDRISLCTFIKETF